MKGKERGVVGKGRRTFPAAVRGRLGSCKLGSIDQRGFLEIPAESSAHYEVVTPPSDQKVQKAGLCPKICVSTYEDRTVQLTFPQLFRDPRSWPERGPCPREERQFGYRQTWLLYCISACFLKVRGVKNNVEVGRWIRYPPFDAIDHVVTTSSQSHR